MATGLGALFVAFSVVWATATKAAYVPREIKRGKYKQQYLMAIRNKKCLWHLLGTALYRKSDHSQVIINNTVSWVHTTC